ncbi:MAG: protease complex subunit PrcB family protein [Candidatus Bathyarchaeota archaeon]|nr:protease complex subunit PrcB family protein [Candidatus Bathyarchaeota archaeon]
MNSRIVTSAVILAIIGLATAYGVYAASSPNGTNDSPDASSEIVCPEDGSLYVWTPIGTFSENFNWRCLLCSHTWIKTYPEDKYKSWRNALLEPAFVRDYTLLYLRAVLQMDISDPLALDWTGGRETPEGILGYETFVYRASAIAVTIGYPVVLPENTVYTIKVEVGGRTEWEGQLRRREFVTDSPMQNAVYDYSGGVGLFDRGIHIVATSYNPLIREASTSAPHTSEIDYWQRLKENVTITASPKDFISIIISRGDRPTGGYTIRIRSFSWLESYPVKFRFSADFTDPGEGVAVTQALTNPLVLVPIGELSPGEYIVEVHIIQYIMTYDKEGNPVYTPLQTFKEEVWEQSFTIR